MIKESQRLEQNINEYSAFQKGILEYAKREFPGLEKELKKSQERSFELQEKRKKLLKKIEQIASEKPLSELTDKKLLEGGIERQENNTYKIAVKNHFHDKRLPEGYGYKGGAARSLLLRNIGIDPTSMPRDIDIVRLSEKEPHEGVDEKLAKEYMPDDFAQGHGVEFLKNITEYLNTRDLTINELYATDEYIVATDECLRDTIRHIICQSDYEYEQYYDDIGPKMLAKMLRFYSEALSRGMETSLDKDIERKLEEYSITWF